MNKQQKKIIDEYVIKMLELPNSLGTDNEAIHYHADDLLLSALKDLGLGELSEAFEKISEIGFWYA